MVGLSNVTVGWTLLIGVVLIGIISLIPAKQITDFHLHGRRGIQVVGTLALVTVVFFWWIQEQQGDIRILVKSANVQAESAENQAIENEQQINDLERVRDDAQYTACVDRNETRRRVRAEYRAIVAQQEANIERVTQSPPLNLSQLPGYSEIQDPAVKLVLDSVTASLLISREESLQLRNIDVLAAQTTLEIYIEAEPFEQCGDDPIPEEEPIRPPIVETQAPSTVPPSTTTTSTTSTTTTSTTTSTTTIPTTTTVATQLFTQQATVPPVVVLPTTTYNESENPNAGPDGNNGNGNGGNPNR